jgi:hypothetical protein
MKSLLIALSLSVMSFSSFADSILVDSARLQNCGGEVQLRSSIDGQGVERYALKFIGVQKCSNIELASGKSYKLTQDGQFQDRSFTLSNESVQMARYGLGVNVTSNSGSTSDNVLVQIRTAQPQPEYESSEWN